MKKVLVNILCIFIPSVVIRHKIRKKLESKSERVYFSLKPYYNLGKNNKIFVIKENGKRVKLGKFQRISNLDIIFEGSNNLIEISLPFKLIKVKNSKSIIKLENNNEIYIKENFIGNFDIWLCENSIMKCGKNVNVQIITVKLHYNNLYIGNDCLISDVVFLSDFHLVLNYETGNVINNAQDSIKIGNHCWLGTDSLFLKKAVIPDDCIVGCASVVTKEFKKSHCAIAGNPAKVVKENVSWNEIYSQDYIKFSVLKNKKSF